MFSVWSCDAAALADNVCNTQIAADDFYADPFLRAPVRVGVGVGVGEGIGVGVGVGRQQASGRVERYAD